MEIQRNPGRPLFWLVFVQTIKCHTNFLGKMPWESKCTGVSNKFTSLIWDCGSVPSRWLHCHHKGQAPPWSCSPKRLDLENISQQFHNFQKLCRLPVCQTKQEYCDYCSCLYVRILLCTVISINYFILPQSIMQMTNSELPAVSALFPPAKLWKMAEGSEWRRATPCLFATRCLSSFWNV